MSISIINCNTISQCWCLLTKGWLCFLFDTLGWDGGGGGGGKAANRCMLDTLQISRWHSHVDEVGMALDNLIGKADEIRWRMCAMLGEVMRCALSSS